MSARAGTALLALGLVFGAAATGRAEDAPPRALQAEDASARALKAEDASARAQKIARGSPTARDAYALLVLTAKTLRDPVMRAAVLDLLERPAPTFMARWPDAASRERARQALVDAGLLDRATTVEALFPPLADPSVAPQPFVAAPGGVVDTHHDHPGGLAEHTAFNLKAALALEASYRKHYGLTELDHDLVVAAPILHDAMKPWALQWKDDGTLTEQAKIAGTSSHHVFILAELMHRRLSPELVVAVAFAHDPPNDAARVGFIHAGAILAGVDPVDAGYLAERDGALVLARLPSIEANIDSLSDHDYVLTDPAGKVVAEALRALHPKLAGTEAPAAEVRWWLLGVKAKLPHVKLYAVLRKGGPEALERAIVRAGLSPAAKR